MKLVANAHPASQSGRYSKHNYTLTHLVGRKKHQSVTFWHTSYVSVLKKKYFLFWERRVSLANGYVKIKQWKSQAWHGSWCGLPGQLVYNDTMWNILIYLRQGWSLTQIYSVWSLQSETIVQKYVSTKRNIKVSIRCCKHLLGPTSRFATLLMLSLLFSAVS